MQRRERIITVTSAGTPLQTETGAALVIVMIAAVVMLISCLAVLQLGAQDAALAVRDVRAARSFFLAESGLARGEAWLRAQTVAPSEEADAVGASPDTLAGGLYSIAVTPIPGAVKPTYTVTATATHGDRTTVLESDLVPMTYTDYLYFVNRDVSSGSPAWFCSGDTIYGPVHTNDQIGIRGDPVFTDVVQSGSSLLRYDNNGSPIQSASESNPPYDNPTFEGGLVLGTHEIPWLDQSTISDLDGLCGLRLNGGHEIVFGRTTATGDLVGYVSYRPTPVGSGTWTDVPLSSFNGVISVNGDAILSGTVDGHATVVSGGQTTIVDDLVYHDSDENGPLPDCDDILGIVAGSKVVVADNEPNRSDCVIHAHIIAINNQACLVQNYDQGSPRGTLRFYGGIAQDKWGPVGTGYLTEEGQFITLTGYQRDFHYDSRLQGLLPPGYSTVLFDDLNNATCYRIAWRDVTPR
jgi:hypothetical protein